MPSISIEGRRYAYEDRGTGVPLVLLHGFPFSSASYAPQLERPPQGVRVIAPDHRGFGASELGGGPSTMEAFAEDALTLLDRLGISDAFVGGVSMGGYVAMALTRLDPGRVRGLLLVDTQSLADDAAGQERREVTARDVETRGVGPLAEGMLTRLFGPQASPALRQQIDALMREQNPAAVAAASRGMASRTDAKDILSRYAGRCTIVVGRDDVITPVERAQLMHGLVAGSVLEIVEGAGHLPHLEQPEVFRGIVERLTAAYT